MMRTPIWAKSKFLSLRMYTQTRSSWPRSSLRYGRRSTALACRSTTSCPGPGLRVALRKTTLAILEVADETAEGVLGQSPGGLMETYNVSRHRKQKMAALVALEGGRGSGASRPERVRGPGDAFDEPICRHGGAVGLGEASGGSAEGALCIVEGAALRRIMGLSRAESGRDPCQGRQHPAGRRHGRAGPSTVGGASQSRWICSEAASPAS
jgi:hypothetical protein